MCCVKGAGAFPGLGLTEPGRELCHTIVHTGCMEAKEFKIPAKCVGAEPPGGNKKVKVVVIELSERRQGSGSRQPRTKGARRVAARAAGE